MRKDEVDVSPAGLGRAPARRAIRKDGENHGGARQFADASRKRGGEPATPPAEASAEVVYRSHRELGTAILAAGDPVKVGCELLDKNTSEDRGAPTRLKSLQTFADWAFEKPGADGYRKPPRIIWDIPGPPYEPVETEEREGGDK